MTYLLTAAAGAAAAAAAGAGPAGWIALAVVGALTIVGGILLKNSRDEKEREQAEKILEESKNIAKEQGVANTDNVIPNEKENAWVHNSNSLVNGLTGQKEEVTANDRAAISKGNIVENILTEPQRYDDSLVIVGGPPKPNIEEKTDERVTVNTIDWGTLVGEKDSTNKDDNNKEDEEDQPIYNPSIPSPEDKTEENLEEEIPNTVEDEWERWYKLREEQWAREDAIRKETQEREDTAYQRAIADMKKAGLNPNIFGVQPAESGGGITQASMPDMSAITNQMNIDLKELQQLIDQNFQGDENTKDRLLHTFTSILSMIGMLVAFKK